MYMLHFLKLRMRVAILALFWFRLVMRSNGLADFSLFRTKFRFHFDFYSRFGDWRARFWAEFFEISSRGDKVS